MDYEPFDPSKIDPRVILFIASCPNVYGRTFFPYRIIAGCDFACLLLVTRDIFTSFSRHSHALRTKKLVFCSFLSLFLFIRTICYLVPFPFNGFTCELFTQQLPHFILCLSWIAMSLWLSSALFTVEEAPSSKRKHLAFILLAVLIAIEFVVTLTFTILASADITWAKSGIPPTVITNCVLYCTILISISIFTFQLLRLSCSVLLPHGLLIQIRVLAILCVVMFIVYFLRTLYSILRISQTNPFQTHFVSSVVSCIETGDCQKHTTMYVSFQAIWEFLPTVLLIVMLFILRCSPKRRKNKKKITIKAIPQEYEEISDTEPPKPKRRKKPKRSHDATVYEQFPLN
ncbi:hypothetical protein BLNAU_4112 [Blattamonas nauphoetae]|uniref:Uncharacterized protein n=1 Tax=Blattamonas nauphoetae TaxID=2049346 RepID=A0ABQ9YBG2_9EUKA|nr:hypothetical protein BLNAU_4112 [Blattamonas nauphoetae]